MSQRELATSVLDRYREVTVGPESARRRHISPWTPIVLINFPLDAPSARANISRGGKLGSLRELL